MSSRPAPKSRFKTEQQHRSAKPRLPPERAGTAARDVAVAWIDSILRHGRSLDEAMAARTADALEPRDRALARLIVMTVLRRRGTLDALIAAYLQKPLPGGRGNLSAILQCAAAQIVFLETPPHAPIAIAVDQCRADKSARRFDKLANAVLRRISENKLTSLTGIDTLNLDIPDWLFARWRTAYGAETARAIAAACLEEAPHDLTVTANAEGWARRLGGMLLPTGSVRLAHGGRVENLDGYAGGQWWVQDAAAALPAKLLGNVRDLKVADLCAAPGGKTLQLAAAGADVTAIDISAGRLERLWENLRRTNLQAKVVVADVLDLGPSTFDAVLLDAPCTATGTIRRHPDILALRRAEDLTRLADLQSRLLHKAASLVRPGGTLMYCSCSLEPEEGIDQIRHFIAQHENFRRLPLVPGEFGIPAGWISETGDLRTLPSHAHDIGPGCNGIDGFFAARLLRQPD